MHACSRAPQLYERAAAEGRASEGALLRWPALALRLGRVRGALAAAHAGTCARPASPALWRQRIVLSAQQAAGAAQVGCCAHALLCWGSADIHSVVAFCSKDAPDTLAEPGMCNQEGMQPRSNSSYQMSSCTRAIKEPVLVRQEGGEQAGSSVAQLVQEAVAAVPAAEAAELWALGFHTLASLGQPLECLAQRLCRCLAGSARGPARVRAQRWAWLPCELSQLPNNLISPI
jgi:hypothetical protein